MWLACATRTVDSSVALDHLRLPHMRSVCDLWNEKNEIEFIDFIKLVTDTSLHPICTMVSNKSIFFVVVVVDLPLCRWVGAIDGLVVPIRLNAMPWIYSTFSERAIIACQLACRMPSGSASRHPFGTETTTSKHNDPRPVRSERNVTVEWKKKNKQMDWWYYYVRSTSAIVCRLSRCSPFNAILIEILKCVYCPSHGIFDSA